MDDIILIFINTVSALLFFYVVMVRTWNDAFKAQCISGRVSYKLTKSRFSF